MVIIDAEWEELTEDETPPQKKSAKKEIPYDIIMIGISLTVIFSIKVCAFVSNYIYWSTHGGATLSRIIFGS